MCIWYDIYIYVSKGNVGYPWQGTLAVVPRILPHLALYNHYVIHILVVYVGIYVGYSPKGTQLFHLNICISHMMYIYNYICPYFYNQRCAISLYVSYTHQTNNKHIHPNPFGNVFHHCGYLRHDLVNTTFFRLFRVNLRNPTCRGTKTGDD